MASLLQTLSGIPKSLSCLVRYPSCGALTDTEGEGEEMPVVEAALTDIEGEGEGITGDVGITAASTSRQVLSLQK